MCHWKQREQPTLLILTATSWKLQDVLWSRASHRKGDGKRWSPLPASVAPQGSRVHCRSCSGRNRGCKEVPSAGGVLAGEARVAPALVAQGRRGM